MKLWIVLLIANAIGGTWGPLPYDYGECIHRIYDLQINANRVLKEKPDAPGLEGLKAGDVKFECIYAEKRPALTGEIRNEN